MSLFDSVSALILRCMPLPHLRSGATGAPRKPVRRIIVFGRHPNPTTDYYFAARLPANGMPPHMFKDIRKESLADIEPHGAFVIICRYASASVLDWIERERGHLAGVGLFLDDDIPATIVGKDASFDYKLFLFYRALLPLRRLNRHLDIVWTSTPMLAGKLAHASAIVLPPAPPRTLWEVAHDVSAARSEIVIAYHATAGHVSEHSFLQPIIHDILEQHSDVRFEVFAGKKAKRLWKGMKQVTVRTPVSWADYLAEASTRRIDIMLVPLSPSPVNECRSPTKRIDVARTGAAGIFSISGAYGQPNMDGEIILPYDPAAWRDAILSLISNPEKRRAVAGATRVLVERMSRKAEEGIDLFMPENRS